MGWKLAPDVTFCVASNKAIFLDVRADRYTCLPGHLNAPFVQWVSGHQLAVLPDAVATLESTGLLESVDGDAIPVPCGMVSARSAVSPQRVGPVSELAASIRFHHAFYRARRRVARRGLTAIQRSVTAAGNVSGSRCRASHHPI